MSQRRLKGRNKDRNKIYLKQEHQDNLVHNYNHLFDEVHPPESYVIPESVILAAAIHVSVFNTLLLIGQYIVLFGNQLWRYETKLFIVSILLSFLKPCLMIFHMIFKSSDEKLAANVTFIIRVIFLNFCVFFPQYHYDSITSALISICMLCLTIYTVVRTDIQINTKRTFYSNYIRSIALQFIIATAYPQFYFLFANQYAFDELLPIFILGFIHESYVVFQEFLFSSHVYANIYKYQGYWSILPNELQSLIIGHIEAWKPNHVYGFGSVVVYANTYYIGMGYLNNIKPESNLLDLQFRAVFDREVMHQDTIIVHLGITTLCCILMIINHFQLRFAVLVVISIISLILTFPLHTMAFN